MNITSIRRCPSNSTQFSHYAVAFNKDGKQRTATMPISQETAEWLDWEADEHEQRKFFALLLRGRLS